MFLSDFPLMTERGTFVVNGVERVTISQLIRSPGAFFTLQRTGGKNCFGAKIWADALNDCNTLADGMCGLTDGSLAGDWRLPNVRELHSLVDFGEVHPPLPSGHPFTGVPGAIFLQP